MTTTAPGSPATGLDPNPEAARILERDQDLQPWTLWGSYLPDRQWGTVREDYSADGDAWRSFPPRSGPFTGLPLGGRRVAGHLR